MRPPSEYDIGPELGDVRLGVSLSEVRRVGDDVAFYTIVLFITTYDAT